MDDRQIREALPEYLLGTLESDSTREIENAMAASPALRREADALARVLFAMPEQLEPEPLPEDAWPRLRDAVRRESGSREAGEHAADLSHATPVPILGQMRFFGVAFAFSLVLLVAVGVWGWQNATKRVELANEQRIIAYWMRNPDLRIISLEGVGRGAATSAGVRAEIPPGIVCVLPDGRAMMLQPYDAPRGTRYVLHGTTPTGRVELGETTERFLLFEASDLTGVELTIEGRVDALVAEARF